MHQYSLYPRYGNKIDIDKHISGHRKYDIHTKQNITLP